MNFQVILDNQRYTVTWVDHHLRKGGYTETKSETKDADGQLWAIAVVQCNREVGRPRSPQKNPNWCNWVSLFSRCTKRVIVKYLQKLNYCQIHASTLNPLKNKDPTIHPWKRPPHLQSMMEIINMVDMVTGKKNRRLRNNCWV